MTIIFDEDKQNKRLVELRKKEEEGLAQMLAQRYGFEYVDLGPVPINIDALKLVTEDVAKAAQMVVFNMVGKKVQIGILTPANDATKKTIEALQNRGLEPRIYMVSQESLKKAWEKYKDVSYLSETKGGALDISSDEVGKIMESIKSLKDVIKLINETLAMKKSSRISRILEILLAGALAIKASDIHVEPEESYVRLRYRLDGILNNAVDFDRDTFRLMSARIKLLSGLKLNIQSEAQDGRFTVKIKDLDIEIRTSIIPGAYSESIVMRVLNPLSISVPLSDLGIEEGLFNVLSKEIDKPNGMILTTGPTGSGKTTTLYAVLKKIHSPEVKIITIEDPIEYHLPGIVQTQVEAKKGYTFLEGLRSALRQDPDVIMVGEIRDSETMQIAINSSLTGHLVFSTLHTNSAAGSFARMIDLGADPKIITSAVNLTMAQRLIRRLCPHCRKQVKIEGDIKKTIDKILDGIVRKEVIPKTDTMYVGGGCDECNNTGFKGRIGIYEAIRTDEKLEKLLRENPSERDIKRETKEQGLLDMREDGIIKVLKGITAVDELKRVVDLEYGFVV
jgi:type IV pilus assembly protein PilB